MDILVTVCGLFVILCVFVRFRISPSRIKPAASNFARWFIDVLGKESSPLGNVTLLEAKIGRIVA